MPSAQEIKQQQAKLDEILKQQEIVADSVKRYKTQLEEANKETFKVTEANSILKDNADSIQKNIDFLNGELEKRKKDVRDFEENYNVKSKELENVDNAINQKNLSLTEMEKEATERISQEVNNLQSEADGLLQQKNIILTDISLVENKINKLNEIVGTLNDSITILKSQEKDQKTIVDNETVNINELTKEVDKLKEKIESYTDVLDVIKQDIKDGQEEITGFEDIKRGLTTEITNLSRERDSAQAEFDELSLKSRILIERGEFQDGQAVYLKEQFEKIGREYQPYAQ